MARSWGREQEEKKDRKAGRTGGQGVQLAGRNWARLSRAELGWAGLWSTQSGVG